MEVLFPEECLEGFDIKGAYLCDSSLEQNPSNTGDGCFVLPCGSQRFMVAVVDISLCKTPIRSGEDMVTESRILSDAVKAFKGYPGIPDQGISPFSLLEHLCGNFYPDYLNQWRCGISWGFSVSAALMGADLDRIQIASVGTNFVGTASRDSRRFSVCIYPNRKFFSPDEICTQDRTRNDPDGGRISIDTAAVPANQAILLATDGIRRIGTGLFRGNPAIDLDNKKGLLTGKEGLYVVCQKSP